MGQETSTVSDLFAKCLELETRECEALLGSLEPKQPEVVCQVRELLDVYERHPHFLEHSALEQVSVVEEPPPASPAPRPAKSIAFWLFLAIDFIALGFYIFAAIMTARYSTQTVDTGFDTAMKAGEWYVVSVHSQGPASGKLAVGDRIVAMNGDARMRGSGFPVAMESIHPGASYTIRVLRNGDIRDFTVVKEIVHRSRRWGDIMAYGLVSLAFFLTAVVLGILKSDQRVARRGYAALMSEALVLVTALLSPYRMLLSGPAFLIFETFSALDGIHFALGYHFYCTLFDRVRAARAWKYALYVMYPWALLITFVRISVDNGWRLPFFDKYPLVLQFVDTMDPFFYVVAPLAICAVIARNYVKVREPDDRRRARWIAFGSLAGILPYSFVRLIGCVLRSTIAPWVSSSHAYQDAFRIAIFAAVLIPAATGYAIYKHRMFDIRVVVRQGVRYMLAKSVLQAVLALPALGLVVALVSNAHRTVAEAVWNNVSFIVLLAMLAAVLKFRVPLRHWLDRRFFRESYRQEQLLLSLTDSVQKVHSLSEMAHVVAERVTAVLHPESVVVMYRARRDRLFTSAYSVGQRVGNLRFPENSPLVSVLETGAEALTLSSITDESGVTRGDRRRLEGLGIDLIVPMNGTAGDLVGLILLGRRLADEPFTSEDRKLLTALGGQMAMVYENISLHEMLSEQQKAAYDIRSRLEARGIDGFRECPRCGRCYDLCVDRCLEDGTEPVFSLPIQRTIDRRYRLERLIGKGGMGAVYEAGDLALHRRVAIKVILGDRIENPIALQRVYREARAAARLNHPNIIATYDFGVLPGEVAYLVMELVPGQTLREAISSGRKDLPAAEEWFDQLLAGVEAAHRAGIIHRDLKPENVLISVAPDGSPLVKILDFGIAKTATAGTHESASITRPGTVLGSIQYMSPEQLNGERVDERSDIFSIGVMIFEILTGRLPFSGSSYTERIISLLHDEVLIPQDSLRGGRLEALLKKCLAREPQQRFASAAELRRELAHLIGGFGELSVAS